MAGSNIEVAFGSHSITTSGVLMGFVTAPTHQRVRVREIKFTGLGIFTSQKPVLIELVDITGAGTGGTTVTPVVLDRDNGITPRTTALKATFSGAPTVGATIYTDYCPGFQGVIGKVFGDSEAILIAAGGMLGVKATLESGETAVNCRCALILEE
jgi:hypothetical protein